MGWLATQPCTQTRTEHEGSPPRGVADPQQVKIDEFFVQLRTEYTPFASQTFFTESYPASRSLAITINNSILSGENGCQTFKEGLKTLLMPITIDGAYLGFERVEKD